MSVQLSTFNSTVAHRWVDGMHSGVSTVIPPQTGVVFAWFLTRPTLRYNRISYLMAHKSQFGLQRSAVSGLGAVKELHVFKSNTTDCPRGPNEIAA